MQETTIAVSLELHAGALRLALRPDLGGAIAGLWHAGVPVLRSTEPAALASARLSGCYPLVPYSNRVGYRRFEWQGQAHTTAANFDDNPHSVHGVAWQRAWTVLSHGANEAELQYVHTPDAHWPFAFTLRQRFELTPAALRMALHFTNDAPQAQPVGLGWHPYFPKRERSTLQIQVQGRWDSDAVGLPTQRVPQPPLDGPTAAMDFDHCFDGWQGPALLHDEALSLRLSSSLPYLVIFTPATKPYHCVEPVSHVSNAIQRADPLAHGLQAVAPGGHCEGWMELDVAEASR